MRGRSWASEAGLRYNRHEVEESVMKTRGLLAALSFLACAAAQAQSISVEPLKCVPKEDNTVIRAALSAEAPGQTPRLYFRWQGQTDFYWVDMQAEPGRRFWAIPPKPERRNDQVEYYAALVDAAGKVSARSPSQTSRVTDDCKVELSPKERGVAENLTVGETTAEQQGAKVMGFLCKGIVTRINSQGIRRSDEICAPCAVVWWDRKSVLIPAFAGGVIGVIVGDRHPEPSPSRP
jgi:hypothetical protein